MRGMAHARPRPVQPTAHRPTWLRAHRAPRLPWLTLLLLAPACTADLTGDGGVDIATVPELAAACGSALAIASATVSGAQDGNPGSNAIDGDLATRWSQRAIGATLTVDLGSLKTVCSVGVAWYSGAGRTSKFTIGVSKTGAAFDEVLAGSSSGATAAPETYGFAARDARFVRLTVLGNSLSDWASVTELTVAGGAASKLTAAQRDALVYGNYKPSAATVGPVPEVDLTQFGTPATSTDVVVTANNQVVENLEIWGRVDVKAFTGVTIRNCIIHGSLLRNGNAGHIIGNAGDLHGATIIDTALVGRPVTVPASFDGVVNPDAGSINLGNEWAGGIGGGNYKLLRTEIKHTSDGLALTSQVGNVTAKGCWIHDGWFNEWTPAQGSPSSGTAHYYPYSTGTEHYTHVDGIQFHRGKNYTFIGNFIGGTRVVGDHNAVPSEKAAINSGDDMYNAALMIKQEVDATAANKIENVLIDRNWLAGGAATVNITFGLDNHFETVTLSNNRFVRSTWGNQAYVLRWHDAAGVDVGNFANNVFDDDGSPVTISRGN